MSINEVREKGGRRGNRGEREGDAENILAHNPGVWSSPGAAGRTWTCEVEHQNMFLCASDDKLPLTAAEKFWFVLP